MKTLNDIAGFEYDWLACDCSGQIALLTTAGSGYAPKALLTDTDSYDHAIELILNSEQTTTVVIYPNIDNGLNNIWKAFSDRGIYGYDADYNNGKYSLVSFPASPLLIIDLPVEAQRVATRFKFINFSLNSKKAIIKLDIVNCEPN